MRKIVKFNTSYGTLNQGDAIINESIDRELGEFFRKDYIVELPTHTPVTTVFQIFKKNPIINICQEASYKIICGTNILTHNMLRLWPQLNINIINCRPYIGSILVGAGLSSQVPDANFYTKMLYKKILSKDFIHSVRDEKTKEFVEKMGFRAIDTGCPTIWSLTKQHCSQIPTKKSDRVIFTLTDYSKNLQDDQLLIDVLRRNYQQLIFWVQGSGDFQYLQTLNHTEDIQIIYSLEDYKKTLMGGNIDYVGTRLHAGILALQNRVRSIIISVDNRAEDMQKSHNLPVLRREEILSKLEETINSEFITDVHIDEKKIEQWKSQFKESADV